MSKYEDAGIEYSFSDSSVGALLLFGSLHNHFGVSLNKAEKQRLGKTIAGRLNYGLFETSQFLNHVLGKTYGVRIDRFNDYSQIYRTSYDYMRDLTKKVDFSDRGLNIRSQKILNAVRNDVNPRIRDQNSSDVYLRSFDFKRFKEDTGVEIPLDIITVSKKSLESTLIKLIRKLGNVLNPSRENVRKYAGLEKDARLSDDDYMDLKKEISENALNYLIEAVRSPLGFYSYHYFNTNHSINHDFNFNSCFLDDLSGVILVDTNRLKLIGDESEVRDISRIISNRIPISDGNNYGVLLDRMEEIPRDNHQTTDGSETFAVCGKNIALFIETKLQTTKGFVESQFGGSDSSRVKPHGEYGKIKIKKSQEGIKGNDIVEVASIRASEILGVDRDKVLNL